MPSYDLNMTLESHGQRTTFLNVSTHARNPLGERFVAAVPTPVLSLPSHPRWSPVAALALLGALACSAATETPAPAELRFEEVEQATLSAAAGYTLGASWADFDGDGRPDPFFFVLGTPGAQPLFHNTPAGLVATQNPTVAADGVPRAGGLWADIDNDDDPDLFEINSFGINDRLFRNDGGNLVWLADDATSSSPGFGQSGAAADVNGDGWIDLFVPNGGGSISEPNYLFLNQAGRGFAKVTSGPVVEERRYSSGASFADLDSDGDMDLFVANIGGEPNSLFRNDGTGQFALMADSPVMNGPGPVGGNASAWGDFDNDGDLDLFVTHGSPSNRLFRNRGDGHLEPVDLPPVTTLGGGTVGAVWVDLDNNGWLDLVVARREGFHYLFRGTGEGRFEQVFNTSINQRVVGANGIAVADYDLDGDQDLLFDGWDTGRAPSLFRNDTGGGHWLRIRLQGTFANRSGVGARVEVDAIVNGHPLSQTRQIGGDDAFCSQELIAHFGLGDASQVERVRVHWPQGTVQQLTNIPAGQVLVVIEPPVREIGPRVLNRQTGLYEQHVLYRPRGLAPNQTTRLLVHGLTSGTRLIEVAGEIQGVPYLDLPSTPGAEPMEFVLSFHHRLRTPFASPRYEIQTVAFEPNPPKPGVRFPVDRAVQDPQSGDTRVEFTAVIGARYGIEYSDDGIAWKQAQILWIAGANRVRWLDRGLPATDPHPSTGTQRRYQAIRLSP